MPQAMKVRIKRRTLHQVANELALLAQKIDGVAAVGPHRVRGSMVRRR
jgi:hypothetical protein